MIEASHEMERDWRNEEQIWEDSESDKGSENNKSRGWFFKFSFFAVKILTEEETKCNETRSIIQERTLMAEENLWGSKHYEKATNEMRFGRKLNINGRWVTEERELKKRKYYQGAKKRNPITFREEENENENVINRR